MAVALGRDRGIVGKRGSNAPALGRDGAGVLFDLFPHTKEGRGPSAHSESEGVQPVSEASAFSDAYHSGPPRCLFPHSHSQGAQEIPPFPFSRKGVRAQGSPLWPVSGSPHLYKMYGRGTRSSPAPGCSHSELPGRLADMCPFRAAGKERHRGSAGPSSQAGLGLKQGKKLPYSFKDGNLSRLGVGFECDESLLDPQEALSVERTFVPLQCDEAGDREVWPEAARAVGGSHPGGAIGAAPHAPAAAVVCPAQSEPLGGWLAASPLGARLPGSRDMVAYDSGPSGGCSHGSGMFQSHNIYRRLHEGLGRSVPGLFSPGSVEALLERGSCEPTRVRGSASGVDVLSAGVPGEAGPHQDRQFCGGFLYQPPGGYALSGASQRSSQASFVGAGSRSLLESGVPARERQCGSRSSVQGRPPSRGMAAPPSHRAGHLGPFRPGSGGPLCLPGDYSLPLVVFDDRPQGHIGGGCPSVHMAPGPSVRFSPLPSSASGAGPSEDVAGQSASGGPGLASSALDGGASDNAGGNPLASPGQAGHAHAGAGPAMASEPRVLQAACLAPGRGPSSDLGAAVIRTLQAARAPSTRGLYAGRWNRFCGWCHSRGENPVSCGTSVVLAFLQSLLESGLSVSTLRGYVAAISSRHELVDGLTMGTQALVGCFLKGARRLCPPRGRLIPAWDLRVVLDALTEPPFEPLSGLGWELLSLKTVFLLAIASAKRVSELRALSVHPACLRLGGEGSAISLLPNPAFLPKVLPRSFVARPLVLDPFLPPPHESPEAARLHLVCPVRALRSYIARTSSIRQTDQLFVCFGESVRGQAVSKQRLARWVVRAIELAYSSAGLAPPTGVVAHSTRGMAAS